MSHVAFAAERPFQFLALLACRRDWVSREELAELLWPERSSQASRGNLRTLLLRAQKIAPGIEIEQQAGRLRWDPDSDLTRFDAAARSERFDDAVALYRGPLLQGLEPGLSSAAREWLDFERERVASVFRQAIARLLLDAEDDPPRLAATAQAALLQDPLEELAVIALAKSCLATQRPDEGLRTLQAFRHRLQAGLGLEPSAAVRALEQRLRDADVHAPPPVASERSHVSTTPVAAAPGNGLIGRRLELLQIDELLGEPGCRLLTVTGPGGIGKSTLVQAARPRLATKYAAGAALTVLDDLNSVDEVPARIADACGVTLSGLLDPWKDLAVALGARTRLLIVDGAERLDGFGAALVALFAACPALKVLNASRARMAIDGEWLLPLDGLPLPDVSETEADVLRSYDAVRVFESRARSVDPDFDLSAQASDVVAVLHAVEGLPLAIGLAAAWVRLMSVREIAEDLQGSVDLLERQGALDGSARDLGVRASFAHSWKLLSTRERDALVRLALLPGPFARDMAKTVAGCELPLLAALVDKSLVKRNAAGHFLLHALIRQCTLEQDEATRVDAHAVRAAHAAFMKHWMARLRVGGDGPAASADMETALPHIRSAWQWSVECGEADFVTATAWQWVTHLSRRGMLAEGMAAIVAADDAFTSGHRPDARAAAWSAWGRGYLHFRAGRYVETEQCGRRSLEAARAHGEELLQVLCLNMIAMALKGRGDPAAARPFIDSGLAQARRWNFNREVGILLGGQALVLKSLGLYDEAAASMAEALELARRASPQNHEGVVLQTNNLANLHLARGHGMEARALFESARRLCDEYGVDVHRPLILLNLARLDQSAGQLSDARRWALQALELADAQGRTQVAAHVHQVLASIGIAEQDAPSACVHLKEALRLANELGVAADQVRAAVVYARLSSTQGRNAEARRLLRWAARQPVLPADDLQSIQQAIVALGQGTEEGAGDEPPAGASPAAMAAWLAVQCEIAACRPVAAPAVEAP